MISLNYTPEVLRQGRYEDLFIRCSEIKDMAVRLQPVSMIFWNLQTVITITLENANYVPDKPSFPCIINREKHLALLIHAARKLGHVHVSMVHYCTDST